MWSVSESPELSDTDRSARNFPAFVYVCFGFASFESGVSSPNFQVYLSGGVPPSTSALNSTVSGACPSSGVPSAQARSGAASSSALPAAAAVVVGAALLGAIVVVAFGASLLPPPPQPARASGSARARAARAGQRRVMQGPPWSGFAERRRILTDDPEAVNYGRRAAPRGRRGNHGGCGARHHANRLLAGTLAALALAASARAAVADRSRPPRELRLLVVLAGFPDRPLAKPRAHFTRQLSRFVAYWTEVSAGRLRIEPTLVETTVTVPGPLQNSMAKSRSLTASIEFCVSRGRSFTSTKPSNRATNSRSIGSVEPASAPLPSGQTLTRSKQFFNRSRSRASIST